MSDLCIGDLREKIDDFLALWDAHKDPLPIVIRNTHERGYLLDAEDPRPLVRLQWAKVRHGAQAVDYFLADGATMRLEPVDRAP